MINLFIDFDGTVADSTGAMADFYNEHCHHLVGFTPADGDDIRTWDGYDQMPLLKDAGYESEDIFTSKFFFDNVRLKKDAVRAIQSLQDSGLYNIYFVSIGEPRNIAMKTKFLARNFPFISNHIMLTQVGNMIMDKSIVDMDNGIFIDDNEDCLFSSNADYKLLFSDNGICEWNENWLDMKLDYFTNWDFIASTPTLLYELHNEIKENYNMEKMTISEIINEKLRLEKDLDDLRNKLANELVEHGRESERKVAENLAFAFKVRLEIIDRVFNKIKINLEDYND